MIFSLFSFKKHQLFCLYAQRLFPVIYSICLNIDCSRFRFSGIWCILSVCSLKWFFISGKLSWVSFGYLLYCFTFVFFRFSYYLFSIPIHLSLSILSQPPRAQAYVLILLTVSISGLTHGEVLCFLKCRCFGQHWGMDELVWRNCFFQVSYFASTFFFG